MRKPPLKITRFIEKSNGKMIFLQKLAGKLFTMDFGFCGGGLKRDEGGDEVDEGHEGARQPVVASGDAPKSFDSTKEPLHLLSHSIFRLVVGKEHFPVGSRRDDGFDALMFQEFADVVAVVGFVHYGGVQPVRLWHSPF